MIMRHKHATGVIAWTLCAFLVVAAIDVQGRTCNQSLKTYAECSISNAVYEYCTSITFEACEQLLYHDCTEYNHDGTNCSKRAKFLCRQNPTRACLSAAKSLGLPSELCPENIQLMKLFSGQLPLILTDHPRIPGVDFAAYFSNFYKALGDFEKCQELEDAQYCVVAAGKDFSLTGVLPSTSQVLELGYCLPAECSQSELNDIVQDLNKTVHKWLPSSTVAMILDSPGEKVEVKCGASKADFDWKAATMLSICVLMACLSIAGTFCEEYDLWCASTGGSPSQDAADSACSDQQHEHVLSKVADDEAQDPQRVPLLPPSTHETKRQHSAKTFLLQFALRQNATRLVGPRKGANDFGCLDGLRVLSMGWVILGHILVYAVFRGLTNMEALLPPDGKISEFAFSTIVMGAFYAVDTFFWLSGFLFTKSVLKLMEANQHSQDARTFFTRVYPKIILARWLRLTPIYAFVMAFYDWLQPTFGSGPSWAPCRTAWGDQCDKNWFANLLYFNNYYPTNDFDITNQCMGHSWYLACDMQYSVLAPLLIFAYSKRKTIGWAVQ
ncbi:hypothetical protein CYMTET_25694, partial [Cymbomonas tetramitiformis]